MRLVANVIRTQVLRMETTDSEAAYRALVALGNTVSFSLVFRLGASRTPILHVYRFTLQGHRIRLLTRLNTAKLDRWSALLRAHFRRIV
jgi:hypothetical protein